MQDQPPSFAATRAALAELWGAARMLRALWDRPRAALAFLTRLPVGMPSSGEAKPSPLARSMDAFPIAGAVIGAIGAAVYALAHAVFPAPLAALLAVTATILVTGGLHEDGLADMADGCGGGSDRERKLAIMRDSRIGTFGVVALLLSLALRVGALAALGDTALAAGALVAIHALARAAIPCVMRAVPPARSDGLAADAGRPNGPATGAAATIAIIIVALVLPSAAALAALAGAALGAAAVTVIARRQIGGYTGDVLGAAEQLAETVALLGVVAVR